MLLPWHLQPDKEIVPTSKTETAAAVAGHIDRQFFPALLADDIYRRVGAAKAARLAQLAHRTVLVRNIGSRKKGIESISNIANRALLYEVIAVENVTSNKLFYISQTNAFDQPLHVPKHMIVAPDTDSPGLVLATGALY